MTRLYVQDGPSYSEATAADVMARAQALIAQRYRKGAPVLGVPERTAEFLKIHLGALDYEVFGLLHLDARYRLIEVQDLFRGTIDGASVHPREVVKAALASGAHGVVVYHNHPSTVAQPTYADESVTRRIKEALQTVDIRLVDHLIVGEEVFSFAARGLL